MNKLKQSLLIGAGVVTIGASGLGLGATSFALSSSGEDPQQSLIDKLVSKFNLKESEVEQVFDEMHAAREKEMKTQRESSLKSALEDGKITQTQYDHIQSVMDKMDALHDGDRTEAKHKKMHTLMDKLRKWMEAQNIDKSVLGMPPRGHGPGNQDDSQE